jgi:uncharacterized membrane protein YphA (DoxX/SURF4 family)
MSVVTDVEKWGDTHHPGFIDFFRMILGLFITYKGLEFLTNMDELELTASGINVWFAGATLAHYVVFAHILGGPLLAAGLFTRIICVLNLPVLLGAIIFVNAPKGFLSVGNHMELEISLTVTAGLIIFMIFGGGRFSIDAKRKRDEAAAAEREAQEGKA